MADVFELKSGEVLVLKGRVNWKDKMTLRQGTGFLTGQRYVQYSRSPWIYFFGGLIAELIASFLIKDNLDFEIPVNTITGIAREKQLLNNNIVVINTVSGQQYRLFGKWDLWFDAFQKVLIESGAQVTLNGENSWSVTR